MSIPLPKLSRVKRGRTDGDPIGSEARRGKAASKRLSGRDIGSWTPTEQRTRERLMKVNFGKLEGPGGNSKAYVESEVWCPVALCRKMKTPGSKRCVDHS